MKLAEDGEGVILRLVERYNSAGAATLNFDRPIQAAWSCDLMEKKEEKILSNGSQLDFKFKPFEVKTLRVFFERM